MGVFTARFGVVEPIVTERACGGWLAVGAPESLLRIGVTAASRELALDAFAVTVRRWEALLDEHYATRISS
jgi:hypothetical protein